MTMNVSSLGHFPIDGPCARETGEFTKITPETALRIVSGKNMPVLLKFFVSNDVVNFGTVEIPTGGIGPRQTECDHHNGDAIFYVEEGPATFLLTDSGEVYQVESGDFMFLPEKTNYKIINYTGHMVKTVFIIAPAL